MDLFLGPLVTRLLRRFVKTSAEGSGNDLRVTFASPSGSIVLHNLELNLDFFPVPAGVCVKRAFARQLKVLIPWASLAIRPIEVRQPVLIMQSSPMAALHIASI